MAELHVQPKKRASILPWALLLLLIAALVYWFLIRKHDNTASTPANTADSSTTRPSTASETTTDNWSDVDFDAPTMQYDEVTNGDIQVRGTTNYGIYGLGENILFDEGKATIKPEAESNLKQITSSISKRYASGNVRVYGYTDAQGSSGANKELAQQRADAVKAWLQSNGIDQSRISVNAIGEAKPVATNNTEAGRQQNRRVEIVARSGKS